MRCVQQGLQRDGEVDETVAHKEEHGDDRCHVVKEGYQDAQLGNDKREAETAHGLATPLPSEELQVGDDVVFCDRL